MSAKQSEKPHGKAGKFKPHRMIRISEYLASRLELAAQKGGCSMSDIARAGIRKEIVRAGVPVEKGMV